MVFLTAVNCVRKPPPPNIWNRRRTFMLSALFRGCLRDCYGTAIRSVRRALQFNRLSRPLKKQDFADLWEQRISAATLEHGLPYRWFHEGLLRAKVFLSRKVLADLAMWEPRTFRSLVNLAWTSVKQEGGPTPPRNEELRNLPKPPPVVHTRGMIE